MYHTREVDFAHLKFANGTIKRNLKKATITELGRHTQSFKCALLSVCRAKRGDLTSRPCVLRAYCSAFQVLQHSKPRTKYGAQTFLSTHGTT